MISDKIVVRDNENECEGLEGALAMVKKTAEFEGFPQKDVDTLSLLAQEMIIGSAAIMDVFTGTMWTEAEDSIFSIKLEMEGLFTQEKRDRLVALTRDNKNTLPKGFFARLGVLIGDALTGEYFYPVDMSGEPNNAELFWESSEIQQMIMEMDQQSEEDKELAEKAKGILDEKADDVRVEARSNRVLVTVTKKIPQAA